MTFPCEKCGACCRAVKCDRLKNNLCDIYETRPACCNVEKMAGIRNMDKSEAYRLNKIICKQLQGRF